MSSEPDSSSPGASAAGALPPASFEVLATSIAAQAMDACQRFAAGGAGAERAVLDEARFHIDLLQVLEEKTQGRLTSAESDLLGGFLHQLRMAYVELAKRLG